MTITVAMAAILAGCGRVPIPGFPRGPEVRVTPERVALIEGDTFALRVAGRDSAGRRLDAGEVVWTSSDSAVAQALPDGRVAAVGVGRARVTARVANASAQVVVYVEAAVFVGAGDIAVCGYEADEATAELLDGIAGLVWTTGDNAYPSGTLEQYQECYGPSWGRHKQRTRPTPGNHEYRTPDAEGYFEYFGDVAGDPDEGWYSYRYGGWLMIALNSKEGLEPDSDQLTWLRETLAENPVRCTLAYFHHPLFSSGSHGDYPTMKPFWDALYAADADVILVGHDHHYERFAPLDPNGHPDPVRGIRQFLVGTGGAVLRGRGEIHAGSELFSDGVHGVLELVLHAEEYEWQFVAVDGRGVDAGRGRCH